MQFSDWLEDFVKTNIKARSSSFQKSKFLSNWGRVINPAFITQSRAVKYDNEILWVEVKSNQLLFELKLEQNSIISKYKKLFPTFKIKKIYFTYNPSFKISSTDISSPGDSAREKERLRVKNGNFKIELSEKEEFKKALVLPQATIHSFFLNAGDEVQPFDLF